MLANKISDGSQAQRGRRVVARSTREGQGLPWVEGWKELNVGSSRGSGSGAHHHEIAVSRFRVDVRVWAGGQDEQCGGMAGRAVGGGGVGGGA